MIEWILADFLMYNPNLYYVINNSLRNEVPIHEFYNKQDNRLEETWEFIDDDCIITEYNAKLYITIILALYENNIPRDICVHIADILFKNHVFEDNDHH